MIEKSNSSEKQKKLDDDYNNLSSFSEEKDKDKIWDDYDFDYRE